MASQISSQQASEIISRIIKSSVFEGSRTMVKLLQYLAEKSQEDSGEGVKEYQIATEALGRKSDFDPRLDAYVRTQITRLRSKLLEYTLTEGVNDPFRIEIPKGAYKLVIVPASQARVLSSQAEMVEEPDGADAHENSEPNKSELPQEFRQHQIRFWEKRTFALTFLALAVLGVVLWALMVRRAQPSAERAGIDQDVAAFWKGFVSGGRGPLVVYSNARFVGNPAENLHYFDPQKDPPNSMVDFYTGVGEVLAIDALDKVFIPQGISMQVKRGDLLSLDDAQINNLIFVGAPAENPSVKDVVALRYFGFQPIANGPRKGYSGFRNLRPQNKELEFYVNSPDRPIIDDYAIVARVPGLNQEHKILLAAGTTTIGTEAAIEFVCHKDTVRLFLDKLGTESPDMNFEAVLYIKIARGVPIKTELVAFRKYAS